MYDIEVIPQANNLDDVINVIYAIHAGNTDDQSIAMYLGKGTDRQGRYYRKSAEILGFVFNFQNTSSLTDLGDKYIELYIQGDQTGMDTIIMKAVFENPAVSEIMTFVESNPKCTRAMILNHMVSKFNGSDSTIERRMSSVLQWLKHLNAIDESDKKFIAQWKGDPQLGVIEVLSNGIISGSVRKNPKLRSFVDVWDGKRIGEKAKDNSNQIDEAAKIHSKEIAQERALVQHQLILRALINVIRNSGSIPQYNQHIDLFTELQGMEYIFEVKSCNNQNFIDQARRGLSQLLEYRYMHHKPNAKLVLVLEKEPKLADRWYIDFLVKDQSISVCWMDENKQEFTIPLECKNDLSFL